MNGVVEQVEVNSELLDLVQWVHVVVRDIVIEVAVEGVIEVPQEEDLEHLEIIKVKIKDLVSMGQRSLGSNRPRFNNNVNDFGQNDRSQSFDNGGGQTLSYSQYGQLGYGSTGGGGGGFSSFRSSNQY
ncbi:hypothetical protein FQA39_LY17397 [Lamprigera yunnana]|nr:hypothetical protein FQA39_LY17397 [Lamprigera yunnana]